jgi:hypothetical protein
MLQISLDKTPERNSGTEQCSFERSEHETSLKYKPSD